LLTINSTVISITQLTLQAIPIFLALIRYRF